MREIGFCPTPAETAKGSTRRLINDRSRDADPDPSARAVAWRRASNDPDHVQLDRTADFRPLLASSQAPRRCRNYHASRPC